MKQSLTNKIALVTGASSGIGKASAIALAQEGVHLILAARRLDRLTELAQQLSEKYAIDVLPIALDVQDRDQVANVLSKLEPRWQAIDILINNAGLALATDSIQQGNIDNWETMIDTNVKGLLYVTRAILPGMLSRNSGHVINIGSIAGRDCYPSGNVYCATKHAVKALSQSMRMDVLGSALRVSEIAPGAVETEFSVVRWNDQARADAFYADFQPLLAEDIADAALYCLTRPSHVDVSEMVILPTVQASANHLARKP